MCMCWFAIYLSLFVRLFLFFSFLLFGGRNQSKSIRSIPIGRKTACFIIIAGRDSGSHNAGLNVSSAARDSQVSTMGVGLPIDRTFVGTQASISTSRIG